MSGKEEKAEPFVILPFPTYRTMDQKLKKAEMAEKVVLAPSKQRESQEDDTSSQEEEEKTPPTPLPSTPPPEVPIPRQALTKQD